MHLYRGLEASSSAAPEVKAALTAATGDAASSTNATKSLASNIKSIFSSSAPMAVLHTAKQGLLFQRRKYVGAHAGDVVDLVICIASIIGALVIIFSYCWNRRSRKLRHALILGLATSDLVSSLIITATTSYLLAGKNLGAATKFCTFSGFAFASAVWTQHLWNLSIASITYMILVHPMSTFVSNVERHIIWLWPAFWAIAMIVNGIAWRYVGFKNVDGYCTFDPHRGGDSFAAAFQFVPRGFVVVVILVLYTHLFFFLRRTNLFSAVHSNGGSRRNMSGAYMGSHNQNRSTTAAGGATAAAFTGAASRNEDAVNDLGDVTAHLRTGSMGRTASAMIAKVRRTYSTSTTSALHSPSTLVDDSNSKRNGSGSTQGKASQSSSGVSPPAPILSTMQVVDFDKDAVSPKSKPAEMESGATAYDLGRVADVRTGSHSVTIDVGAQRPAAAQSSKSLRPKSSAPAASGGEAETSDAASRSDVGSEGDSADNSADDLYQPMAIRRDVRDFGMTSPPQEHLRHYSLSAVGVKLAKRALAETAEESMDPLADVQDVKESTTIGGANSKATDACANVAYEDTLGADWTWGMPVSQGGATDRNGSAGSAGLGHGPPPSSAPGGVSAPDRRRSSRWQFWSTSSSRRDGQGGGTSSTGSSTDENGVNATGSTLNRQASVLLLLYPAMYVLLFSLSIVRIIVDLSTPPGSRDPRRNSDALHTISRWTIFAQGAIDAIIFQLIEQQFRRRMKRRRRIAAGEKVEDSLLWRAWTGMSAMVQARRGSSSAAAPKSPSTAAAAAADGKEVADARQTV